MINQDAAIVELDGQPLTAGAAADAVAALALVNYGHFTTMRVDQGGVRGLDLHLDRLTRDSAALFGHELDLDRVRRLARRVAGRAPSPALLRVTIFDPDLTVAEPGTATTRPRVLVSARPASTSPGPPLRLRSVPFEREAAGIKHTGLFGPVRHRREAQRAGYDDVLFVTPDGLVNEGPTWNIGFVVDGQVWWPTGGQLAGVTMRLVTGAAGESGTPVRTAAVNVRDLPRGCAAFVTSTGAGLRGVRAIDGSPLAQDVPVLDRLRTAYERLAPQPL